ncbi:MAG: hypothetical protein IAE77_29765 [Prosthecobacter sp.]|jgi:hypothetical protein|uniref:hypothetical protein n=1 Tax=Prosthecobacter sp. TaxID=1965333 RepID=UPI0019EE59C4|nr:hypothetical protein [Prosthecobacter sp.]MBE2287682.1 hypothetical protein [Prosthecobacter sp.]
MKSFLCLASLLVLHTAAIAGPQKVQVQVHVESERGSKDSHDAKSPDESRARWLIVRVSNPTPTKLEGLTLQWTLYADDLKRGHDEIIPEKSGSETFSVDPSGHYTDVTTAKVSFEWTPQHSVRISGGRRPKYKRVDESGHRYHGYTVQILQGGEVIGQATNDPKLLKPAE